MSKNKWIQVLDELDACASLVAVWAILKGGEFVGRIMSRPSKSKNSTQVTFELFGKVSPNGNGVYGTVRMAGWGYNRFDSGLAEILSENREKLKAECGIELSNPDWNILNTWEKDITAGGYTVIRVI